MAPEPAQDGFAAAYRAVADPAARSGSYDADQTARMDLSMDTQATEAMPRVADGSTLGQLAGPRPRLRSARLPCRRTTRMHDTGYNIPTYGNPGAGRATARVMCTTPVRRTPPYGTYNANDTYNSGPATDTNARCLVRLRRTGLGRTLERAFRRL